MDKLTIALESVDLPALILELFPNSEATPGKSCKCLAVWRGEKNKSASVFRKDNVGPWLLKDHATGECVNAFGFLVQILDYSKQSAAEKIISFAGLEEVKSQKKEIVATYDYTDEEGNFLFQTVRFKPKSFAQRIHDGVKWIWKLGNTRRVLYNLPEVLGIIAENGLLFLVEGEEDVATLKRYGFVATTCPMGAGKWHTEYTQNLTGARLIISPDNDKVGYKHAETVAKDVHTVTTELKIIKLLGLKEKEDITDWFNQGHTAEELLELVKNTKPFEIADVKTEEKVIAKAPAKETPAQLALRLLEGVELFHSPDEESYASISVGGHVETYHLSETGFKRFVTKTYWKAAKNTLNNQTLADILSVLDAKAQYDGQEHSTFHRLARFEDSIYIDLCNGKWEVVEITTNGWQVISTKDCPVKFTRPKGIGALPTPERGGSVDMLRAYIHVPDEEWLLIASFLMACFKPEGPYPILNLVAEQGSGKSTTAKILKWLVDPTSTMGRLLRISPRDEQAVFIGAKNNHVLAFDNLSGIRAWLSDALCILSTGGSYVTRALYTNSEESTLEAMRPVILTGIGDLATRGDLLSRSLIVNLPRLTARELVGENMLWKALEAARPQILGALLDAVSLGIRNEDMLEHKVETRLADFELWAAACEPALAVSSTSFSRAYKQSRQTAVEVVLSNSPLPPQISALLKRCGNTWQGTSSELLADLEEFASERTLRQYGWPKIPNQLSKDLDRLAPSLREIGISIERFRGRGRTGARLIQIKSI